MLVTRFIALPPRDATEEQIAKSTKEYNEAIVFADKPGVRVRASSLTENWAIFTYEVPDEKPDADKAAGEGVNVGTLDNLLKMFRARDLTQRLATAVGDIYGQLGISSSKFAKDDSLEGPKELLGLVRAHRHNLSASSLARLRELCAEANAQPCHTAGDGCAVHYLTREMYKVLCDLPRQSMYSMLYFLAPTWQICWRTKLAQALRKSSQRRWLCAQTPSAHAKQNVCIKNWWLQQRGRLYSTHSRRIT